MTRRIEDRNIYVIYLAILLLGIAYGTSIAVIAIHLKKNDIPEIAIGGLAAAFASGIVVFSLVAGKLVHRFGQKRTFIASLLGYAVCVSVFPFLHTFTGLAVARFFDGAFSVGIWVAAETALLSRSGEHNKAYVTSLYAVSLASGYVIGPVCATGIVPIWGTGITFVLGGILSVLSALVIVFKLDRDVAVKKEEKAESAGKAATVLWRIKTALFGAFSYGYFQASVVLFLPLYLIGQKHVPESRTILVTACFAAGMLSMANIAGRFGDRFGHLLVMRVLGAVGGAMVASFVLLDSFYVMLVAVFIAGATLASISPVSLALQGHVTPKEDLDRANSFYNAAYAAGMLLGPMISGALFTRYGGATMLFHLAGLWATFVALSVVFAADDPSHRREVRDGPEPMLR